MKHIDIVLRILERESLYTKMSKCELGMTELLYLGHIISAGSVKVDLEKIQAIVDWSCHQRISHFLRDSLVFVGITGAL